MLLFMYRIHLSAEQHHELRARTRQTGLAPSTRDRLEMVRLSDAGWSVPRIARHLGQHEQTVRMWIKAFLGGGFAALANKPRGGCHAAGDTDPGSVGKEVPVILGREVPGGRRSYSR